MITKFKSFFQDILQKFPVSHSVLTSDVATSLDIGDAYVKAVSVARDAQGQITIVGFACEKNESNIKEAVKSVLSKIPVKRKEIALSISGRGVVLRYVNLPLMSPEETANAMSFELEKYIPFSQEEVNYDFSILKKNKNTGKMLVLIAAAKKSVINDKIGLCEQLGYKPRFIDVDPLAIANYCSEIEGIKQGVCAVVDLGSAVASLDILEDGLLVLSRDIFIGGNDFTKKISENLNQDFAQAEQLKLTDSQSINSVPLETVLNNLTGELKVSFDFYETQTNRLIDRIFITGGTAKLKGIVDILHESLGQEVEVIGYKPDKLKLDPSLDLEKFKDLFNYFIVALGTALR